MEFFGVQMPCLFSDAVVSLSPKQCEGFDFQCSDAISETAAHKPSHKQGCPASSIRFLSSMLNSPRMIVDSAHENATGKSSRHASWLVRCLVSPNQPQRAAALPRPVSLQIQRCQLVPCWGLLVAGYCLTDWPSTPRNLYSKESKSSTNEFGFWSCKVSWKKENDENWMMRMGREWMS